MNWIHAAHGRTLAPRSSGTARADHPAGRSIVKTGIVASSAALALAVAGSSVTLGQVPAQQQQQQQQQPAASAQPSPATSPRPGSGGGPPPPYSAVRWNEDYSYLKD